MIRKITLAEFIKASRFSKNQQRSTKNRISKSKYYQRLKERYESEMSNLQFKTQTIEFFPDDVEKMKNMTPDEKRAYIIKLKNQGNYKVKLDETENK